MSNKNELVTGQIISTLATGTAPLSIASTTLVNNLYVAKSALSDTSTTIPNLTGPITSSGVATAVAAQTGTDSVFVMQASPTLTTPNIGIANGTSLDVSGALQCATVTADATMNQIVMGTTNTTTISSTAPAASRTITLHDPLGNANFVLSSGGAITITDTPALGEFLVATSTSAATWQPPLMQYVRYTLTATEIRGLYASPVTILASPGVGYGYAIDYVSIFYSYSTAVFAGGGAVRLKYYTNGANLMGAGSICTTTILGTAANDRRIVYPDAGYTTFLATNQVVRIENDTAAFTGATAAGTLQVNVYYTMINQN